VISLAAASEMEGRSWVDAAHALSRYELLSDEHVRQIALLDAFGAQIANNDRHLHNVCVFPCDDHYELAPAFDQLPMAYAPQASGNMLEQPVKMARPNADTLDVWDEAGSLASTYWHIAADAELTDSMHAIAAEHAQR
jgi:serine/threonine protein kinase HipA of HipAB toxin-antitoxin module